MNSKDILTAATKRAFERAAAALAMAFAITIVSLGTAHSQAKNVAVVEADRTLRVLQAADGARKSGKPSEAEAILMAALADSTRFGPPAQALFYNDLGSLFYERGRLLDSEYQYRAAWAKVRSVAPPGDRLAVRIGINLAASLVESGQEAAAQRVLDTIATEGLDKADGLDVARLFSFVGSLALRRREYGKSEDLFREAMARLTGLDDAGSMEVRVMQRVGLASLYIATERKGEAAGQSALAVAELDSIPSPSPVTTIATLRQAANLYCRDGEFDKAGPLFRRAIAVAETSFGRDFGLRVGVLYDYAAALRRMKLQREARAIVKQANTIAPRSRRENLSTFTLDAGSLRP